MRRVLANWNPSDPYLDRHDDFAAYYTSMINRMRGEVVEGIHQAALAVFRGRTQPPWETHDPRIDAGRGGRGAPPAGSAQANPPPALQRGWDSA